MGIHLRRGHRCVSEQVGERIDPAADIQNVGGEGVPQPVRTDWGVQPGPARRRRASSSPTASGRSGAPTGARNRFTNTKSLPAAAATRIRSNS